MDECSPPVIWNCNQNFSLKVKNHAEGWHRKFNLKVGVADPTFFKFIRSLQEGQELTSIRMLELDNGHRLMSMTKKYSELNERIAVLTSELNDYERTLKWVLDAIFK